jgi:hypothetical protein
MLLTEYEVFKLVQIQLLHIHLFLSGTLRVIVLFTFRVFTFYSCAAARFTTNETFVAEATSLYVFDAFDTDSSVFLLKIALRYPDSANIMHPYVVTHRYV